MFHPQIAGGVVGGVIVLAAGAGIATGSSSYLEIEGFQKTQLRNSTMLTGNRTARTASLVLDAPVLDNRIVFGVTTQSRERGETIRRKLSKTSAFDVKQGMVDYLSWAHRHEDWTDPDGTSSAKRCCFDTKNREIDKQVKGSS